MRRQKREAPSERIRVNRVLPQAEKENPVEGFSARDETGIGAAYRRLVASCCKVTSHWKRRPERRVAAGAEVRDFWFLIWVS